MKFTYMKSLGTFSPSVSTQMESQIDDLQGQIDTINEASDVADVVATYADLQAYDTSTLTNKDVIKVLTDSTHDNKTTYYRYLTASNNFTYIGAIESYYTKLESDAKFQDKLVNQTNIKSINGNSILGSGNLEIASYLNFPSSWPTTSSVSTKSFCDTVAADSTAIEGKMYLGEVRWNDLPSSMVNAEVSVNIMKGSTAATKVIVLEMTSGNKAPYKWQYTYWNNGSNVSGWIGFTPIIDGEIDCEWVEVASDGVGIADLSPDALDIRTSESSNTPARVYLEGGDGESQIQLVGINKELSMNVNETNGVSITKIDGNTTQKAVFEGVATLTTTSVQLVSGNIYNGGELASVNITLPNNVSVDFVSQLNFTSGTTATVFNAPNTIYFNGDACEGGTFTPLANHRYMVLITCDGINILGFVIEK